MSERPETLQQPETKAVHHMRFTGSAGEYFGIWIVNILLSILTLGVYSAWAKVRNQQYFYGHTRLDGQGFEYLATPVQILIGRLIAVALIVLWTILNTALPVLALAFLMIFSLATPWLAVRNLRFDAMVSRYRNVRFNFVGSYGDAYLNMLVKPMAVYFGLSVVMVLAIVLGVALGPVVGVVIGVLLAAALAVVGYAFIASSVASYVLNNYRYGSKVFSATIEYRQYLKIGAIGAGIFFGLLLVIGLLGASGLGAVYAVFKDAEAHTKPDAAAGLAVIGFYLAFFAAGIFTSTVVRVLVRNYLFSRVKIDGELQLGSHFTVGGYLGLVVTNLLLVIFTLGLASAVAKVRYARYLAEGTSVSGDLALVAVQDHDQQVDVAVADEVASAFDVQIGAF